MTNANAQDGFLEGEDRSDRALEGADASTPPGMEPQPGEDGGDDDEDTDATRRRFLMLLMAGAAGAAGATVALPVIGFIIAPVRQSAAGVWRSVGRLDDFAPGETVKVTYVDAEPLPWAGFASRSAAWLRREGEETFTAFSIYCTHTACPVRWVESAGLFLCPCHGGAFYRDGQVAAGPPPRPLERLPVRVRAGQVEVFATGVPTPDGEDGSG